MAHPLIIDCDPGIDDALALLLAAASPEFELRGVTCVAGNRPLPVTTANAGRVLALAGRADVPVFAGCARSLAQAEPRCNLVHGDDGLGGVPLPPAAPPQALHAVRFLADSLLAAAPGTLTLVAIGPLTNLALAEIAHPGVLQRAKQVMVMGGAVFCAGNITPHAEFNVHADPLAAHVVLGAGAALSLFGLDVTRQARMPPAWIDALATLGNASGKAAHHLLQRYAALEPVLHDACPVAALLQPGLFEFAEHALAVDWAPGPDEGRVRVAAEPAAGCIARVALRLDAAGLLALLSERLARLP